MKTLQDILFSQGFGTRRVCCGLIQQGLVTVGETDEACTDPLALFATQGLVFRVQGQRWPYAERAYLMLHKPTGTECSQKPGAWPSVYTLLPAPLRGRPGGASAGVQAVGRLDQDTTGLLLLSDDGHFIHRLSSPRHHVPKLYHVSTRHPVSEEQRLRLLEGVRLDDEPRPVRAAAAVVQADGRLDLTLTEGKYHQVKRMLAAVGNRVDALHRQQIGDLVLPETLTPGAWAWLSEAQVQSLMSPSRRAT